MNLDQFLVSEQPHLKQVTMPDGSQQDLYFLEPTAADIRRWHAAETSKDVNNRLYGAQELIAACLYDPTLQRRVFDGDDHAKHLKLNHKASACLLAPILELAGVYNQKKDLA